MGDCSVTDNDPSNACCPRCGGAFHCGAADAGPCACMTVRLDSAQLRALDRRFCGCLCLACLTELARAPATQAPPLSAD